VDDADIMPVDTEAEQGSRLPFAYARRFGVLIHQDKRARDVLVHRVDCSLIALLEAQRFARRRGYRGNVETSQVSDPEFDDMLTAIYVQNASKVQQTAEDIDSQLGRMNLADVLPETEDLLEQADDAPIIRLINVILAEAVHQGASDVHVETHPDYLSVRFRVDGIMHEAVRPKLVLAPLLVSRIKVMAKLDIAEKRVPQDGRIALRVAGQEVDVRVSTLPTKGGERVVMRLLAKQTGQFDLESLGMPSKSLSMMRTIISKPHGVFLVTGPTGSGKTTTLYASLTELNPYNANIMTVEDPVEYNLSGISQTQVNNKSGMTFAKSLRAILRQDPDIIMVGEIRDLETANIAVQFSLTGHLVMSTLHTNTAVGVVTRLMDMGVEPYLLSSCLTGLLAQRLVRKLCPDCRIPYMPSEQERNFLGVTTARRDDLKIYRAQGCKICSQSGYRGRTGIYELILITEDMRTLIHDQAAEQEIEALSRQLSPGIQEDGCKKVLDGVTSISELLRVTGMN